MIKLDIPAKAIHAATIGVNRQMSDFTRELTRNLDYDPEKYTRAIYDFTEVIPERFRVGLITGPSGSGKSSSAKRLLNEGYSFADNGIVLDLEQYDYFLDAFKKFSKDEAKARLFACGVTSIPMWLNSYSCLSEGEKARVRLAYALKDRLVFDEFTSTIHRTTARALCVSLSKFLAASRTNNVILVSCHDDFIEELDPDWIIDTQHAVYYDRPNEGWSKGGGVVNACFFRTNARRWDFYKSYHYLTSGAPANAVWHELMIDGFPAGIIGVCKDPAGRSRACYRRVARIVIHPDFAGIGLGSRMLDYVCYRYFLKGKVLTFRTSHDKMIAHCSASARFVLSYSGSCRQDTSTKFKTESRKTARVKSREFASTYKFTLGLPCREILCESIDQVDRNRGVLRLSNNLTEIFCVITDNPQTMKYCEHEGFFVFGCDKLSTYQLKTRRV